MIFKKAFFSALILIFWVHVCYGVIQDKPTVTSSSATASPTWKSLKPSMSALIQVFRSLRGKSKVHGDLPFDDVRAGSDNYQGNIHISRPQHESSLSKDQISITKTVEIHSSITPGKNRIVPIVRDYLKRENISVAENAASTPVASEAVSAQPISLVNENPSGAENPASTPVASEADSTQPTTLIQEQTAKNDSSKNPKQSDLKSDTRYAAMTITQLKEFLAKRRFMRLCFSGLNPFTGETSSDVPKSLYHIEETFNCLLIVNIYALSKAEYDDIIREQRSINVQSKSNNITGTGIFKKFDEMTILQIIETARERYTRMRIIWKSPFTGEPKWYENNTEAKIELDFYCLKPSEVALLAKLEFEEVQKSTAV